MSLHPQVKELLARMAEGNAPPLTSQTPEQARHRPRLPAPKEDVAHVEDRKIPGPAAEIPIRIYHPQKGTILPILVYAHGGGWVLNDLDTHDHICRSLANQTPCVVVSVDYRLAPEHKFPAALHDMHAAVNWVAANAQSFSADGARIAVGGDSSGGNLAAAVALMNRDLTGPKLCCQLLVYPITDYSFTTPSYREFATGYFLTKENMMWFWQHYLAKDTDGTQPYASPLQMPDPTGLPPAFIITAEYDPLRDEGEAYARLLEQSGNQVQLKRYKGMIHAFFGHAAVLDTGKEAIADAAAYLHSIFADA